MFVIRVCRICNKLEEREIDINSIQLYDWMSGTLLQVAAPHLTDDEREFMISGTHPECWDKVFPEEDQSVPDWDGEPDLDQNL